MRILIDGRQTLGGVARYVSELVNAFTVSPEYEVYVFGGTSVAARAARSSWRAYAGSVLGWAKRILADQLLLPRAAQRFTADMFHSTNYLVPRHMRIPTAVTCHDLTLLDDFESKKRTWMTYYERRILLDGMKRAAHIIAPSQTVAARVRDRCGGTAPPVSCVYPILPAFSAPATLPASAGVQPPFLLSVGTLEPRKNLGRVIAAHELAYRDCPIPLYVVGAYGWRQHGVLRSIRESRRRVRWLGFIDDTTLGALYRAATAVIQFSLDEGFDYPVAEALSCATPVVLSDIGVHREIAGDCGVYADPHDVCGLAQQIVAVATWPAATRAHYAERARAAVSGIRERGSIGRYLEVYRQVVKQG